ncbi:MAG TPA: DUF952 domain-containing protein [Acidimicrobiales bacterium]|nr:DUF952 domain-containing protein [Acidimicrobiales bacterium]
MSFVHAEGGGKVWIYHLALRQEWRETVDSDMPYVHSTLGRTLAEEGFIHCSFATQVEKIANLIYRGRDDVLLLVIDPSQVQAEIRVENCEGGDDKYPHIYGELPRSAVVRVASVPSNPDGTYDFMGLL